MRIVDMISMAVRNLLKRKLRTFLTVLGVIIGTASIVVMVSIGIGMNVSFQQQLEEYGSLYVINVYEPYIYEDSSSITAKLDADAVESFKEIEGVEAATPVISQYMQLVCGKYVSDAQFMGIDPAAMEALGFKLTEGRLLNSDDSMNVVVGAYVAEQFYNPKLNWRMRWNTTPPEVDLFNEKVQVTYDMSYGTNNADKSIKPYKVNTVGLLDSSGEYSYSVIMPIKDLEKIKKDMERASKSGGGSSMVISSGRRYASSKSESDYDQILVKCYNIEQVGAVQEQINNLGYETYSLNDALESMKETSKMLQVVLGAIGAISLFVAAIGITNTMVMSIYERTREIGVMKVIGASLSDIKGLFLVEAAFIGFSGGVLGMILSLIISRVVNTLGTSLTGGYNLSSIPLWLGLAAVGFAALVGIIAGFFPARRATKLSALSAIRTE